MIDQLKLPDSHDRHVLAAAIVGRADVIVTVNLKHFPVEALKPYNIKPQHPDDFIFSQFARDEPAVLAAFKEQRASLKRPPLSAQEFIESLAKAGLPRTVEVLRNSIELL